jgi:hypothetical protein
MNKKIVISIFFFSLLISVVPLTNIVKSSTAVTYSYGFEDGTHTMQYSDGHLSTKWMNAGANSKSYVWRVHSDSKSGDYCFKMYKSGDGITSWVNYSYAVSNVMTNWSINLKNTSQNQLTSYMKFYNSTGVCLVWLSFDGAGNTIRYRDSSGYHVFGGELANYQKLSFEFTDYDSITYHADGTTVYGNPYNVPLSINQSRIISSSFGVETVGGLISWYIDDVNMTISSSFSGGVSASGCTDFSGFDNINVAVGHSTFDSISQKYIEFQSMSTISAKLRGFELLVSPSQISSDSDLNNYLLYVNNVFIGSPVCYTGYSDGYMLQWDFTSIGLTLTNELPVFELVHATTNPFAWYLGTNSCFPFQDYYKRYEVSNTNIIDGNIIFTDASKTRYSSPNWILYYSNYDSNATNPGFNNAIDLYDGNHLVLPIINYSKQTGFIYKTIFIDVHVDTVSKYTLNIYDSLGVQSATEQFFPKDMLIYHSIYGWTPTDEGNYTISLKYGSVYTLNKSVYIDYFYTDFALWTMPNPSYYTSSVTVGVYANDTSLYSGYAIGIFDSLDDINNFDKATISIDISSFNNHYYYTDAYLSGLHSPAYLRLFGTIESSAIYRPITGIYLHYTEYLVKQAFIMSSLQYNTGTINQIYDIFGTYTYTFSSAKVFLGNEQIYDVPTGSFSFNQQQSKAGTYTYYLKELDGNTWVTLSSVTVSIQSSSGGSAIDFLDDLPLMVKVTLGLVITLIITLLPLIIGILLSKANITMPNMIYVAFFFLGLGVSCMLGFLPWAVFFIILFGLIIYFVVQHESNNK